MQFDCTHWNAEQGNSQWTTLPRTALPSHDFPCLRLTILRSTHHSLYTCQCYSVSYLQVSTNETWKTSPRHTQVQMAQGSFQSMSSQSVQIDEKNCMLKPQHRSQERPKHKHHITKTMVEKKTSKNRSWIKTVFASSCFHSKWFFCWQAVVFFSLCNQDSSKKIPHKYPSLVAAMTWELSKVTSTWVPRTLRQRASDFPERTESMELGTRGTEHLARRWYASRPTAPRISEA